MLLAGVEPRPRLALPATPPAQLPESAQIRSSSHHEPFQGIILHGRRAVSVNFVVLTLHRFVLCRVRRAETLDKNFRLLDLWRRAPDIAAQSTPSGP